MNFQLSVSVKLMVIVYWERLPCVPVATTWGDAESVNAVPQLLLPPPVTVAVLQAAVTAETGTVGQLANVDAAACAVRVQLAPPPK
jgi:hypothetical protein